MRTLLLVFALLVFPHTASSQVSNSESAEQRVQLLLGQISKGDYVSVLERSVDSLGDSGSVALMKLLGGKELSSDDISDVLEVIHISFEAPGAIVTPSDRTPRATLFLLRDLSFRTDDQALKKKIVDTMNFVQQAALWKPTKNHEEK